MWDDEDNNPYASFDRRDSDTSPPESPSTRYHRPSTPPSGRSSPQHEHIVEEVEQHAAGVDADNGYQSTSGGAPSRRKENYESRVERLLYEHPDLNITITTAGKNTEGGGNYIVYTIRTYDLEVRRRYSDFYSLRQTLVNLHPTLIIPPIPEKHTVADYAAKPTKAKEDEAIIDHRKRMLTSFLNRCRRMRGIREDGVFWKFLDPHASWNEVLHNPPISTLPKNNLKVPPLDAINPSPGHSFLPIPATNAKLKFAKTAEPSGTPSSSQIRTPLPSAASHTTAGPQIFGKFPPQPHQLSESELDPYFVNFEQSSRELEALLQGNVEKVNKRTISHLNSYAEDLAELGARFNAFSLSETSPTLAAAIEKIGQAVDSTYMATGELSSSLSSGFCEPMRESAQFASIVRGVLRYRILKRVQEEMTRDELERKKELLGQLEFSELEAKRIDQHLENSGYMPGGTAPKRSFSTSSPRAERPRAEEDNASIDSDFPSGQSASSAAQGVPSRSEPSSPVGSHRKSGSGNFMGNKLFGRINHAIHGMVDVDPERTRRDQMGKTKESLVQLEQALDVSVKDVKDASAGVMDSLKEFQSEKEDDLRRYMVAYARSHIAWAKKNLASWAEAKTEVEGIQNARATQAHSIPRSISWPFFLFFDERISASGGVLFRSYRTCVSALVAGRGRAKSSELRRCFARPGAASARRFLAKTSFPKKRKITYSRHQTAWDHQEHNLFTQDDVHTGVIASSTTSSPPSSSTPISSASPSSPRLLAPHLHDEIARSDPVASTDTLARTSDQGMSDQERNLPSVPQDRLQNPASPVHRTASEIARFGTGIRSASPAKRSRSERDGRGEDSDGSSNTMDVDDLTRSPSKRQNSTQIQSPLPSRTKIMTAADVNQQHTDSGSASVKDDGVAESTSSESNLVPVSSPPTSIEMDVDSKSTTGRPSYDEQYTQLAELIHEAPVEGQKGFVIPKDWLDKIFAKASSSGKQKENFSKEAHEAEVGPVDTRTISLPSMTAANSSEALHDGEGNSVILLIPGLQLGSNIEILPEAAWELVSAWYGLAPGAPPVVRFVVNTNFERGGLPNLQYELYPTLFTLQKLVNEAGKGLESIGEREQKAVQLVARRSERYHSFLKRVKAAVGIPLKQKVQVWKILETLQANTGRAGIPTPVSSRDPSPAPQVTLTPDLPRLTVDIDSLEAMPEGTQRELLDLPDETSNEKYNGSLRLGEVGFTERQTLVVESTGPNADEFASQKSKSRRSVDTSQAVKTSQQVAITASRPSANTRSSRGSSSNIFSARGRRDRKGKTRGSVGLQNLGNTCYMNSALQCIRSVEELTTYFIKEKHKEEINSDNPLGHNGSIAKVYASLIASIYSADTSFSPRNFKGAIGRAQPLFSGYGQQDSQEFVGFLLDALHEDLNRIVKKPYLENPDSDDNRVMHPEYVKELGETYRSNHRKRNDSVAMDLFNGFYKNTMICPVCDKVSVTFDPFTQVTLQLPIENTFSQEFQVLPLDGPPVKLDVDIDKNTSLKLVKEYIAARIPEVMAERLVFGEYYNQKLYKIFSDADPVGECGIQPSDTIVAYEIDEAPTNWPPLNKSKKKASFLGISSFASSHETVPDMTSPAADRMAIPVYQRKVVSNNSSKSPFVLQPFFIMVNREEAKDYEAILRKVLLKVNTLTSTDIFGDLDMRSSVHQSDAEDQTTEERSIPKISARTVEGDEELVDISMTNGHQAAGSATGTLRTRVLDRATYIPQDIRDAIQIGVYSNDREVVPVGYATLSEMTQYPLLYDRAHPLDSRRLSNSSFTGRRSSSRTRSRWAREGDAASDVSEDELAASEAALSQTAGDSHNDDDDNSDGAESSTTERSQSLSIKTKPGLSRSSVRGSIKKLSNRMRDSITRSKSRGKAEDYVLKLGEGLVIDWNEEMYESLFSGNEPDDLKGQRTDVNVTKIRDEDLENRRQRRALRKKQGVMLDECFDETSKSEVLSEDNAWYCPRCKEHRRATKTLELWTVPDILIVHLKRFAGSGGRFLSNKIDVVVDFPVEGLDLSGRVGQPEDKSLVYDLFAVDNHYGGMGGGHYTAYAKNFLDGQWYDYNDTFVSGITGDHTISKAAYLLFYRRREPRHLGPPSLRSLVEEAMDIEDEEDSEEAGKEQTRDSTSTGSSDDSGLPGQRSRGIQLRGSGNRGEYLPRYTDSSQDEGISMTDDDHDHPMKSSESGGHATPPAIAFGPQHQPTWGFESLTREGPGAPASSENGDSGSIASDLPDIGDDDLEDRHVTEMEDVPMSVGGQMAHLPPGQDEEEVAEVRLSDDEEK